MSYKNDKINPSDFLSEYERNVEAHTDEKIMADAQSVVAAFQESTASGQAAICLGIALLETGADEAEAERCFDGAITSDTIGVIRIAEILLFRSTATTKYYDFGIKLLKKCAEISTLAKSVLGFHLKDIDIDEAVRLFQESQSEPISAYELAFYYFDAKGVNRDVEKSAKILNKCWQSLDFETTADVYSKLYLNDSRLPKDGKDMLECFMLMGDAFCAVEFFSLGTKYHQGDGVEKDLAKARKYYKKARRLGYERANVLLGEIAEEENDFIAAARYYKKMESREAYHHLGLLYRDGKGVEKSIKLARKYLEKAAHNGSDEAVCDYAALLCAERIDVELGYNLLKSAYEKDSAYAAFCLGSLYETGRGVECDRNKAKKYLTESARAGNVRAMEALAGFYLSEEYDSESECVEGTDKAFFWMNQAVKAGDPTAMISLAEWYLTGELESDEDRAIALIQRAAELRDADAQYLLGIGYLDGIGVKRNAVEGVKWLKRAANQNHALALFELANCYASGDGVVAQKEEAARLWDESAKYGEYTAYAEIGDLYDELEDYERAFNYYKMGASHGDEVAMYHVGMYYLMGISAQCDVYKAFAYLKQAADLDLPEAQFEVGYMCENGIGTAIDIKKALRYYRLAAAQGDEEAQEAIVRLTRHK